MANQHGVRQAVAPLRRRLLCPGSARDLVVGLLPVLATVLMVIMVALWIALVGG